MPSTARVTIICMLILATFAGAQGIEHIQPVPIRKSLAFFPDQIGEWKQVDRKILPSEVAGLLGMDEYIDYDYQAPDGTMLNLYVSYFSAVGLTGIYHSPRNCLPGGGWEITRVIRMPLENRTEPGLSPIEVNSLVLRKGNEESRFIYWFQNRGRIIASEYWEKFYSVWDAVSMRRRDGAFIRIHVSCQNRNEVELNARTRAFVSHVIATLKEFLPGAQLN